MDANAALGLAVILSSIAVPLAIAKWRRWEGTKVLGQIAAATGGRVISYQEVRCRRHGHELQFVRDRNADRSVITMPLPQGYPLAIDVRKQTLLGLASAVPRLQFGDTHFDAAFAVEAAPRAVVEQLLDERVRTFLLEHREAVLVTQGGRLQLCTNALEGTAAVEAIELVANTAGGVRDAFAKLAAAAESIALEDGASPYRPRAIEAGPDLAQKHEAEVEKLAHQQRRATRVQAVRTIILVVSSFGVLEMIKLLRRH